MTDLLILRAKTVIQVKGIILFKKGLMALPKRVNLFTKKG